MLKNNFSQHLHDFHELIFVLNGNYRIESSGQTHHIAIGGSVFIPAGLRHRPIWDGDFALLLIQWTKDDSLEFGIDVVGYPLTGFDQTGVLKQNLQQMMAWAQNPHIPAKDIAAMLRVVLRQHSTKQQGTIAENQESPPIVRAKQLLNSNLEEQFDLRALAANVGMSPALLGRLFKEENGITPMAYRRSCRLRKAIEIIRNTRKDFSPHCPRGWNRLGLSFIEYVNEICR